MSAFWKKDKEGNKTAGVKKDSSVKEKKVVANAKKKSVKKKDRKKDKGFVIPEDKAILIDKVLKKPMISEAVMIAQGMGKYTFEVGKNSTKKEIALAIESLYGVTVVKVNVVNYKARAKFFRGKKGSTKGYKKVIVTLKQGQEIKLFS